MSDTDDISTSTRVPGTYVNYNFTNGSRTLAADDQYVVILAQRLASGTVPALTPTDVYSSDEAATYFGHGSQAHLMTAAAIRANNNIQLAVCAVDDAEGSVAAQGTLTLTGPATSSGQVRLKVGSKTVSIAVKSGNTADDLLQSLHEALGAEADLPVEVKIDSVASKETGLIFIAKNTGSCGNETGLSLTITATGVSGELSALSGGQGDPDLSDALSTIYSAGHTVIVMPWTTGDALSVLSEYLSNVSGPIEQRAAVGVCGWNGTLATGTTLTGNANAARITCGWHPGSALSKGVLASVYAAIIAAQSDPSEPLDNTALTGLDVTSQTRWPMRTEMEKALHNGLSPFDVVNNTVQLVRAISTYVKNSEGIADPTLLDITTIRTLDYIRIVWRTRMSQRFPNGGKLTDHRLRQVTSETLDVLYALEKLEIVEHIDTYKDQVVITRNALDDTRADVAIPAPVVRGLHILTGTLYLY
ncbi:phage tail protein [Pantoea rodasii]|uniref:Phage tail protein n=1 Tax=Pantoea rodasii TaxID=1076549 RepID=A0A2M9WHH7_9GAMM|nr:phage tail sheath subtilisin-like domain-containing protein [Pantoea rodasii]ORM59599.1 phage tail protein [Pantoea rodasii]PJZ07011.1 phage tail protein [Pantoea rodasii]